MSVSLLTNLQVAWIINKYLNMNIFILLLFHESQYPSQNCEKVLCDSLIKKDTQNINPKLSF